MLMEAKGTWDGVSSRGYGEGGVLEGICRFKWEERWVGCLTCGSQRIKNGGVSFSWWADGVGVGWSGLRGAVDWIRPWVVVWFCWINKKKGPFDL